MIVINNETETATSYFHRNAYFRCRRKSKELHYEFFDHVPWIDEPHKSTKEWNGWKLISTCTPVGDMVKIITPGGRDIYGNNPPLKTFALQKLNHDMYWEEAGSEKGFDTDGEPC